MRDGGAAMGQAPRPEPAQPTLRTAAPARMACGISVHRLQQAGELTGGSIRADLDRVIDARGLPGRGVEPACRGYPHPGQPDPQRRGFPVDVVQDTAGRGQMQQIPAGELGFHRDTGRGPPVRETDHGARGGRQRPGTHDQSRAAALTLYSP